MPKIEKFFFIAIPFLILGIPLYYSVFPLLLAMLFLRCVTSERTTVAAFLILYAGPTIGCIRSIYPSLPLYGLILQLVGILLARKEFSGFFSRSLHGFLALLAVFGLFGVSYYVGSQNEVAQDKMFGIIQNGITAFLGYYVLCRSSKMNNEHFTHMLILTSLVMMQYLITKYSLPVGPLFDYNWFRSSSDIIRVEYEHSIVNYQHIGMNTAFAYAIFMSQKEISRNKVIYYSLICGQLVLMAGARQAVVSVIFVLIIRYLFSSSRSAVINIKQLLISGMLLIAAYYGLVALNITAIQDFFSGGNDRADLFIAAGVLFQNNPLTGVGMGGFYQATGEDYPHNMIYELLAECGLLIIIPMILLVIAFIYRNQIRLTQQTANRSFISIIMLTLGIRCMVSGDFSTSIQLFSALFVLPGAVLLDKK